MVVMLAALAAAGAAGASWRLSDGSGDSEAAYAVPGCTTTVFTLFGLIGSVEPGAGASTATGDIEATRTGAELVRSSLSFPSLRVCATHPSTRGGAVRFTDAMLTLFSIRLRTRASRALAERPPKTTAIRWRLARRIEVTMLNPESRM